MFITIFYKKIFPMFFHNKKADFYIDFFGNIFTYNLNNEKFNYEKFNTMDNYDN